MNTRNCCPTSFTTLLCLLLAVFTTSLPGQDAEGCKDYPLFSRLPGFHLAGCKQLQFDLKRFPIGLPKTEGDPAKMQDVEGAFFFLRYEMNEGTTKPSPLQIMRNFQNAARKGGGTVVAEFPGWCKASLDDTLHNGNGCILYGSTFKFLRNNQEVWAFVEAENDAEAYEIWLVEKGAMSQDISVTELKERLDKDGFLALYINFETGSATIQPDSLSQLEQVAAMLKATPELKVEIGGHTDNVGTPDANQKLSDARARSVSAVLVKQGVGAERLTSKGYGQTMPIADNRTEEGRAKNRRVELVKK